MTRCVETGSKRREADRSEKQTEPRRTTGKLAAKGPLPAQRWNRDHGCPLPEPNITYERQRKRKRGSQNQAAQLHRAIARRSASAPHPTPAGGITLENPNVKHCAVLTCLNRNSRTTAGLVEQQQRTVAGCEYQQQVSAWSTQRCNEAGSLAFRGLFQPPISGACKWVQLNEHGRSTGPAGALIGRGSCRSS